MLPVIAAALISAGSDVVGQSMAADAQKKASAMDAFGATISSMGGIGAQTAHGYSRRSGGGGGLFDLISTIASRTLRKKSPIEEAISPKEPGAWA